MKTKAYQVVGDNINVRKGAYILRRGRGLMALVNVKKMQGAKMCGYTSLFKEWLKNGEIVEVSELQEYPWES